MPTVTFTSAFYLLDTDQGYKLRVPIAEADFDFTQVSASFRCVFAGDCEGSTIIAYSTSRVPMGMSPTGQARISLPIYLPDTGITFVASTSSINAQINGTEIVTVGLTSGSPYWDLIIAVRDISDHIILTHVGGSFPTQSYIDNFNANASYIAPASATAVSPGYAVCNSAFFDYYVSPNLLYFNNYSTQAKIEAYTQALSNVEPVVPKTDPYSPGGTSGPGGGGGSFEFDDEGIEPPAYTETEIQERSYGLSAGFLDTYAPTAAEVRALKAYLWSGTIENTLKRMFSSPMEAIVSLSMIGVTPPGVAANITIADTDTGIASKRVTQQFVTLDCGSLDVTEYWAAYLDYSPYTKIQLFLPYIGYVRLQPEDVMAKEINVKYVIDVCSGTCIAHVIATDKDGILKKTLYTFTGECSVQVPLSSVDHSRQLTAGIGIVGSLITAAAVPELSAPMLAATMTSTVGNVMGAKQTVQRSGAITGNAGWIGIQTPYLIISRPRQCLPEDQNTYTGYPAYITETLGDLSGYTQIEAIHLQDLTATDEERAEIEQLMQGGIIL